MPEEEIIFIKNQSYLFVGNRSTIEDRKRDDKLLGKFIQYIDIYMWGDLLLNAKAVFEYGTVSCGYYTDIVMVFD